MSISEDYERLRKELGNKKYYALNKYIQINGKIKEWRKETHKIQKMEDIDEWEKIYNEIHKKCKPIFIEDVVLNVEEWNKFEEWYNKNYKNNSKIEENENENEEYEQ